MGQHILAESVMLKKCCIVFLALIGFGMSLPGCSDRNPEAPLTDQVHPRNFSNPGLSASMSFHGTEVNTAGTDGCISCHGRDLSGTDTVPGCRDCHFDPQGSRVPPGSFWIHGLDRHEDFTPDQNVCNRCHSTFRRFGLPPEFCHNCHGPGLNHVLGQAWLDKNNLEFHGGTDLSDCSDCHDLNVKCFQCHFGRSGSKAPLGSGWDHGNNEAHRDQEAYRSTCNQCHTLNRSYGNGPEACHDCHED
jgi:hypothetical protein